ncbi:unnamed protein product [Phaeothamnion confervicola]
MAPSSFRAARRLLAYPQPAALLRMNAMERRRRRGGKGRRADSHHEPLRSNTQIKRYDAAGAASNRPLRRRRRTAVSAASAAMPPPAALRAARAAATWRERTRAPEREPGHPRTAVQPRCIAPDGGLRCLGPPAPRMAVYSKRMHDALRREEGGPSFRGPPFARSGLPGWPGAAHSLLAGLDRCRARRRQTRRALWAAGGTATWRRDRATAAHAASAATRAREEGRIRSDGMGTGGSGGEWGCMKVKGATTGSCTVAGGSGRGRVATAAAWESGEGGEQGR